LERVITREIIHQPITRTVFRQNASAVDRRQVVELNNGALVGTEKWRDTLFRDKRLTNQHTHDDAQQRTSRMR
jgi:hypothetical protein